ncbi:protein phosphatase 1 regulatory subunit 16A isoform X2 [Sitodiplosis mosellana]|uniref:protein phosphatase 1 regulatory subunit 16A isoform X2 n=1 Tax=Sitodiplosis mosellana TaxID=263140 RepID=UPI00244404F5|nr:protein phosphatase 1 regulatory subunit 16A isoform X2 [Sitodiplosis mosellana]XP_055312650.1 protein phosphatase 1 regulatory subunit 16A isoform X2 [Sitodiplosis mosellana]
MKMDHSDLVAEMAQVEHLSTQDRLHLARIRRAHQLKVAKQREKEWLKQQARRDRSGNNVNIKKRRHISFENSVVVLEAAARNDIEEVGRFLEQGVSADVTNCDGLTPLHQCCIDNNADMLRLLLDYGANVNAQDSEKWTPLHAAATCGHLYLVKLLISRGANLLAVNVDGNMPYDLCDDEETLDCIEAEMSRRGITQELIDETRASTENQMLNDLQVIVDNGGDIDCLDKQGATPLHVASANGYSKVVEFLLENHAASDAVDKDLWTPAHAAACWGHMEILEMLAMSGADLNAKNKNDETPSDICEDAEIRERIEQLKSEQESKRLAEAQRRRVRRSQSNNTRAQSVRRTSLRDKTLTTKKDAVEETRLRLRAQEGYTAPADNVSSTEPNSISSAVDQPDSVNSGNRLSTSTKHHSHNNNNNSTSSNINNSYNNNNNNLNRNNKTALISNASYNTVHNSTSSLSSQRSAAKTNNSHYDSNVAYSTNTPMAGLTTTTTTASSSPPSSYENGSGVPMRKSPEGKDNDSFRLEDNKPSAKDAQSKYHDPNNKLIDQHQRIGNDISTEIFSASNDNGKINVQVTVLVDQSHAGTTLANLKKQRAQSRNSAVSENGSLIATPSITTATNSMCNTGNSLARNSLGPSMEMSFLSTSTNDLMHDDTAPTVVKFSGVTSDVVSDSTRSRRCCIVM